MPPLTILHTNDLHARLDQMTRLAALIRREREQARASGRHILWLDAGDSSSDEMWESKVTGGRANYVLLEAMACDAAVVGNSDSQWGRESLSRLLAAVHFQTLAANLQDAAGSRPTGLRDYSLFRFEPAQTNETALAAAVVGLTTGEETHADFHTLDPVESLRALIPQVRGEGAQIIVLLSHLGVEVDRKLAAEVPGIHVIVGGHTHTILREPEHVGETVIVQTGEHGHFLGWLDLDYDPSTRAVTAKGGLIPCPETTPPDPTLSGMLELIRFEAEAVKRKSANK